jgi:hypothetical protein
MTTISGCRHLKVNLKAKIYIYVYSTTQMCPNKIIKIFLLEGFFHLPCTGVADTGGKPWAANISANFRKNSKRPEWYNQRLGGNWFKKKTRSKKSRDTVPLNITCGWDQAEWLERLHDSQCRSRNYPGFDPSILRNLRGARWNSAE